MPRKRRGRGEGFIHERPNGVWEARISLGYDAEGKRTSKSVYGKTKAEVQKKLRELQTDAAGGELTEPTKLTVGQYLESWLQDFAKLKCSPTTFDRYEGLVNNHITPHIGNLKLAKLQPVQIDHLMGKIARAHGERSPAWTQKLSATLLSNALRHAVRLRLIAYNPAADLPKAKPAEKDIELFTPEQAQTFLLAARSRRLNALFTTALGSGMRQGELLGLSWEAVDFERSLVTVSRSLAQVRGKFYLKEPKSKRSRRTIRLPAFAMNALREHRQMMAVEGHNSPYVFTTKNGSFIGKSNVIRQVFRPILKSAKLPQVKFHALRHTHASALLRDGASIKAVSQRLGHSTVELTLRVYFHLLPDADDSLAGQAEKLFSYQLSTNYGPDSRPHGRTAAESGTKRKSA